jgi:hypothetical protein
VCTGGIADRTYPIGIDTVGFGVVTDVTNGPLDIFNGCRITKTRPVAVVDNKQGIACV